MVKAKIVAATFVAATLSACASSPGTPGAASTQGASHTPTTSLTPQPTPPAVNTPAAEASYKESAEVVTIEQLVIGRINAPNFPIGTVVTYSGTIQRFLHYSSGQISGLILKDLHSSDVLCVHLSARASAADGNTSHFMNPMDVVTIWGVWQAAASVDNYPQGPTTYPAVVNEMFLSDSTTGTSDNVT
jgi:hypothetical protein